MTCFGDDDEAPQVEPEAPPAPQEPTQSVEPCTPSYAPDGGAAGGEEPQK